MPSQKTIHRPWKYALFAGLVFAVFLSQVSFCFFLIQDIFLRPEMEAPVFERDRLMVYFSSAALSYLIGLSFSLVLGFFLFVRMLRTRPTLLFMLVQAAILWLLMTLLSFAPVFRAFLANPRGFPWRELLIDDPILVSLSETLLFWLFSVVISWLLLRFLRIL